MSKWGKTLLGLAAVGGAVAAGAIYLTKKNKCEECEGCDADFEDDDFDLDSDLKPVERGYVSLTPSADAEEEAIEEKVEEAIDAAEEKVEEVIDAVEEKVEEVIDAVEEKIEE